MQLVVSSSTGHLLRLAVNEAKLPMAGRVAQRHVLLTLHSCEQETRSAIVEADSSGFWKVDPVS